MSVSGDCGYCYGTGFDVYEDQYGERLGTCSNCKGSGYVAGRKPIASPRDQDRNDDARNSSERNT